MIPADIFDWVMKKLSVFDRVRLGIALGKHFYNTRCAPEKTRNRKLGILYRCLKRRLPGQELTPSILEFIRPKMNYYYWDTTFDEFVETFVQLKILKHEIEHYNKKDYLLNMQERFIYKLRNAPSDISFSDVSTFLDNATLGSIDHVIDIIQPNFDMDSSSLMSIALFSLHTKGSMFIEQCLKRSVFTGEHFARWAYGRYTIEYLDHLIIERLIQITGRVPDAHILEQKLQYSIDSMHTNNAENIYNLIQVIYPPSRESAPE